MRPGIDFIGVGVGALIVNEQGKILLARRSINARNEKGMWELPGGCVKFNEKLEDAVKREVREELGIDVEVVRHIITRNHILPGQHWVTPAYLCRIIRGEPKNMELEKCDEIGWFSMDELPQGISQITMQAIREWGDSNG